MHSAWRVHQQRAPGRLGPQLHGRPQQSRWSPPGHGTSRCAKVPHRRRHIRRRTRSCFFPRVLARSKAQPMEVASRMALAGVMSGSVPSRVPASKMSTPAKVTAATAASMLCRSRRNQNKQKTQKEGSHSAKEARRSEGRCGTHGLHPSEENISILRRPAGTLCARKKNS